MVKRGKPKLGLSGILEIYVFLEGIQVCLDLYSAMEDRWQSSQEIATTRVKGWIAHSESGPESAGWVKRSKPLEMN